MKVALQILSAGMLLILTGCVTLYKPNAIHSPMLKEKGEINASASLGLSGCGLYNLQASYAIANHTGIIIDGMYHNRRNSSNDSSVERLNMFFGEAGAGYFTTFSNIKNVLFQCFGGGGYGTTTDKIDNNNPQPGPEMNTKYINVFIQPGLVYINKYFKVAFDVRANYVHLYDIHAFLYEKFEWWNTDFRFYSDTTLNFTILEPTTTLQVGNGRLKGILQLGVTIPVVNSHTYIEVNTSSMYLAPLFKFSIGVTYSFGRK